MLSTDDDSIVEARTQSTASNVLSEICEQGAANANFWFLPGDAILAPYMLWPCVCLSICVCLSEVGVLLKRLNAGSQKQNRTIDQGV